MSQRNKTVKLDRETRLFIKKKLLFLIFSNSQHISCIRTSPARIQFYNAGYTYDDASGTRRFSLYPSNNNSGFFSTIKIDDVTRSTVRRIPFFNDGYRQRLFKSVFELYERNILINGEKPESIYRLVERNTYIDQDECVIHIYLKNPTESPYFCNDCISIYFYKKSNKLNIRTSLSEFTNDCIVKLIRNMIYYTITYF